MKIYAKTEEFAKQRLIKGLSQRELARRSGLSYPYISLIESARKSVGPASALRISAALEANMEDIFRIQGKNG